MDAQQYDEEQAMECESLECILMDDLEVLSTITPRRYKVRILPFVNGEGENHVAVQATFSIPPTYPDVPADVSVAAEKGLSSTQCDALEQIMDEKATENVGMAMVYLLVEVIREWLIEHNIAGATDGSMHAEMLKRMHMKEKAQQRATDAEARAANGAASAQLSKEDELMRQRKLDGTPVTPETFMEWRAVFDAEMAAVAVKKTGGLVGGGGGGGRMAKATTTVDDRPEKPSGKQMFLMQLAGTADEDEEAAQEDEEAMGREGGKLEVDAGLFGEGDDDDDDSDFELDSEDEDDEDSDDESDYDGESEESDDGGKGKRGKGGGGREGGGRGGGRGKRR
eukprot:evm.model.NODE_33510_length_18588_cov_30.463848.1